MVLLTSSAMANAVTDAKQRMSARQGQVDTMKTAGLAGEANTGYLVKRGNLNASQQKVLSAENADRKVLYAAVASKTGSTVAVVGKRRADQIRSNSASGVWIQLADGSWKKK